jgi:hypothetical protein
MQRHGFDPVSAALGALVVTSGALVAAGAVGDTGGNGGWWFAAAAAVVGLAILPWRWDRPTGDELDVEPGEVAAVDALARPDVGE